MDSNRTPLSPGQPKTGQKRRRTSSVEHSMPSTAQQSQTSLPSIRQLHPYLSMSTPIPPGENSAYNYYQGHSAPVDMGGPSMHHGMGAPQQSGFYGGVESEPEEQDQPPKKKRRRQALSCTECKRRKIKCDRVQPCTPCTRRGEEDGCQWHIVEPVEKYATKAEFDELKARFDQLVAFVQRYLPFALSGHGLQSHGGLAPVSSYYPILPSGTMTGATGTDFVAPTYTGSNPGPSPSGMVAYPPQMMPPISSSYSPHLDNAGPQSTPSGAAASSSSRFLKPDETHSPVRHPHHIPGAAASSATPPLLSTSLGHIGGSGGGSMPRHRGSITESSPGIPTGSTSAVASGSGAASSSSHHHHIHAGGSTTAQVPKSSPLSLSSITSPYRPDSYSGGWIISSTSTSTSKSTAFTASTSSAFTFAFAFATPTPRTESKKLVRADAHSGRASAPRIRRPSGNVGGGSSGDLYGHMDGGGGAEGPGSGSGIGSVGGGGSPGAQQSSAGAGGSSSAYLPLPSTRRMSDMMAPPTSGREDRMGDRMMHPMSHHPGRER